MSFLSHLLFERHQESTQLFHLGTADLQPMAVVRELTQERG